MLPFIKLVVFLFDYNFHQNSVDTNTEPKYIYIYIYIYLPVNTLINIYTLVLRYYPNTTGMTHLKIL